MGISTSDLNRQISAIILTTTMPMNELSDEELVRIASSNTDKIDKIDKVISKLDPAQKFAIANNIRRGKTRVTAALIYHTYRNWRVGPKLSKMQFFSYFGRHFEHKSDKYSTFYMLDPAPFDMSEETYWLIRRRLRNERLAKQKHKEVYEENCARDKSLPWSNEKT